MTISFKSMLFHRMMEDVRQNLGCELILTTAGWLALMDLMICH